MFRVDCGEHAKMTLLEIQVCCSMINLTFVGQKVTKNEISGGAESTSVEMQSLIASYANERSSIAANRLVRARDPLGKLQPAELDASGVLVKPAQQARYLDDRMSVLYNEFPFKEELSKSTFFKFMKITGQFKKTQRLSDLCEYCEMVS